MCIRDRYPGSTEEWEEWYPGSTEEWEEWYPGSTDEEGGEGACL